MNAQALSVTSVHRLHRQTVLKEFGSGCLLLLFFSISAFADTHYVSLSGSHTAPFTDWMTAATNIQAAIDVAVDGDTVLVTNGVYDTGGRIVYGALSNRVAITRPVKVRSVNGPAMTIIQGSRVQDGAVRCAYVGTNAVLEGFTLTKGATRFFNGDPAHEQSGGGVWCESSGVLSNCVLTGNSAYRDGGGAYGGTLYNCALTGNSASDHGGGVRRCTLYNCTLTGNFTVHRGGGAYESTLYNCTLTGNSASSGGGTDGSTLYNCTLVGNSAGNGGGVFAGTLHNCTLTSNSAGNGGGASWGTLYNCILTGNSASDGGGAYESTLYNCAFTGNSASSDGGGAYESTLYNCTLTGNSAESGGGVFGGTLYNCIVYYNTALSDSNWLNCTLNYSCTMPDPGGVGNITNNPRFVNAAGGDYHLQSTSPCINAGTNQDWMIGATDLDGNPRLDAGGRVDLGAYEYQGMSIWSNTTAPTVVDSGPDKAVELGVKFRSDVNGTIVGIRFYKAAANTGTHIGNLWTSNGTLLATAPFTNEIASGWQQALFATPVTIASNTVYVASYHANNGHYSADGKYFLGKGVDNPPLHMLMNGVFGGNGVYRYGSSSVFPNQSYNAANYWVDVLFQAEPTLTYLVVMPANPSILIGTLQKFMAIATYTDGSTQDITSQATWTSSDTGVATIDAGGLATGVSDGTTMISASLTDVTDSTVLTVQPPSPIHYVSLSGAHVSPFTSWYTAATNIQAAIDVAVDGDTVVVSNGLYATGGRVIYGAMINRVAITKPVTVRSINGPVMTIIQGAGPVGDSAVRCAYVGTNAVLEGFTLINGATRSSGDYDRERCGGGVWCESSGVVSNCVVSGNSAYWGGGGTSYGTLYHCTLTGNSATYSGGAYGGTLYNCTLTGNSASNDGGGVWGCTLYNCVLTGNSASAYGGGTYGSTLYHCTLTGNSASGGGGGASGGTLNNCTLTGNSASSGGGASGGTLNNCTLTGNSANYGGGVSYGTLYNCIVYYNDAASGANYYNSTFNYSCTTPAPGGSGNITSEPQLASFSHLAVGSPCRGAGHSDYATGTDIDGEVWRTPPSMGCDEVVAGAITGILSVSASAAPTNVAVGFPLQFRADILGRTTRSVWDFGDGTVLSNNPYATHAYALPGAYAVLLRAYNESYPQGITATVTVYVTTQVIHYVKLDNATPLAPYTSWATAATNIQEALDVASQVGALVLVSNGIYATGGRVVYGALSNRVAITKPVTVRSVNGPAMTIIQGAGPVGDSAVRCAYVGSNAVLAGFTLTNGATHSTGNRDREWYGGGVWCESSGVLSNCVLTGNSASSYGGGAFYGTLYNCMLTGNSASSYGGGAFYGTLYNCTLTGNSASNDGGGAFDSALSNCTLIGNSAAYYGGGSCRGTLYNCALSGNSASYYGGGAYGGTLYHCTLTGNSAYNGGGVSDSALYHCALSGNSAAYSGGGAYDGAVGIKNTLYNCMLTGNSASYGGGASGGALSNCTLIGNSAAYYGGGSCWGTMLYNCTLTGNSASDGGGHITARSTTASYTTIPLQVILIG